jgi:hypothetical protein
VKGAVGVVHAGEVEGQRDQPAWGLAVKPVIVEWHEFQHACTFPATLTPCQHIGMNMA